MKAIRRPGGRLERKGKERGQTQKNERHQIIPRQFLFEEQHRESAKAKDHQRDNLVSRWSLQLAFRVQICGQI